MRLALCLFLGAGYLGTWSALAQDKPESRGPRTPTEQCKEGDWDCIALQLTSPGGNTGGVTQGQRPFERPGIGTGRSESFTAGSAAR